MIGQPIAVTGGALDGISIDLNNIGPKLGPILGLILGTILGPIF